MSDVFSLLTVSGSKNVALLDRLEPEENDAGRFVLPGRGKVPRDLKPFKSGQFK